MKLVMETMGRLLSLRWVGFICAALSAAGVGLAVWSEHALGLVPCPLCLWERWPYRVVVVFGLLAAVLPRRAARWALLAVLLLLLGEVAISFVHVGVEFGWWRSPLPSCNAPDLTGATGADDMFARLPVRPAKPCDEPAYLLPGQPLSMAAMNLLFALFLTGLACVGLMRREKPRP